MEIVGNYQYDKKDLIGHGAFAVVFKGKSTVDHSVKVAIKSISKKNLSKAQTLLGKEINILKELHHPNIVQLLDCIETTSNVYLIMEFCNGGDLADYLQLKGTLSEDTIRIFLRQIASALQVLTSKGIVHRDLKPQNILLSHGALVSHPQPADIQIKIADFGFARFLHGEMMAATLCGSPMYMAPEVIMSKAYDAKADLWSVGTIIYQSLTGKAPFHANNPQNLRRLYETTKILKPSIPSGCSPIMRDLLFGLLKRNPKERLSFDEFFSHTFLIGKSLSFTSTPVAVPSRRRGFSECSRGIRSPMESLSSSPKYTDYLQRAGMSSPNDLHNYTGRASPQATASCVPRKHHSSSVPDDFVLVPYDVRCESPKHSSRAQLRGRDIMFSPEESSSPKSTIRKDKPLFSLGSPPVSPQDFVYDRTPSPSPGKGVKPNNRSNLSSPSPSPRTPSPLARDLSVQSPMLRRTSSTSKVSTPPTLEPVVDVGENNHTLSNKTVSPSAKQRTKTKRQRRTTISNAANPMSELRKAQAVIPYENVPATTTAFTPTKPVDIRKSKSSPAIISEAVKNIPVLSKQDSVNSNLAVLLRQLAQDSLQSNLLATLPSPSFKLMNSPPSPKLFPGDITPPPGLFQASSPASWQDRPDFRRKSETNDREFLAYKISSCTDISKVSSVKERSRFHGELPHEEVRHFKKSHSYQGQTAISNATSKITLDKDLSLNPIPPHSPELYDDLYLSQEHTLAMNEIEFLLLFSKTVLSIISDLNITTCFAELLAEQKQRHTRMLPSIDGIKYEKPLMILEALRVSSYALRFSLSHKKKGTLIPTKSLSIAVSTLTSLSEDCIQRMAFYKQQQGHQLPSDVNKFKADTAKIMYLYGVAACQFAASSELMGNNTDAHRHYVISRTIFKGLMQQSRSTNDKKQLSKYIFSITKRLDLDLDSTEVMKLC